MTNLTTDSIKALFPAARVRSYAKGQIICYQGDQPQHIFFVAKGHVRFYDIDDEGNEKILHLIGPNNIFPMLYAFGVTKEVGAFYSTLDSVDIITVPLEEFRHATETNIKFANVLTRWFLTEIDQLVSRLSSLEKTDAREKVLSALKYLSQHYGDQKGVWQQINIPVTHQFLADFTGLARETVSAIMHELDEDNIIRARKVHKLEVKRKELDKIK
ncbi:MAG TPA: Crp/Fnr family transcriptional regulator [Patescibacteria group bacterium]|nr:Crp/Fnr family transcriptional regulator [Patescibacteria group bacterium]